MLTAAAGVVQRQNIGFPSCPELSVSEGPPDVLQQQHEVEIVGRARHELGDEVEVEVASLGRLAMDHQAPTANVIGQYDQPREPSLTERVQRGADRYAGPAPYCRTTCADRR